jgi:NitT/TauT family transport system ATP-binding protein
VAEQTFDCSDRDFPEREGLSQAEIGKTILFVTHDLDEAIYLSNRIVVMGARPGRIKRIIEVPFSYPRKDLPELRGEPTFQEIRRNMWELIRNSPPLAA